MSNAAWFWSIWGTVFAADLVFMVCARGASKAFFVSQMVLMALIVGAQMIWLPRL